jgi:hypothetical protein
LRWPSAPSATAASRATRSLDCFGGSGTTIIAAERAGRRAVLQEIDSAYADGIVRRRQETTGEAAVLERDDRIFTDVAAARGPAASHDGVAA